MKITIICLFVSMLIYSTAASALCTAYSNISNGSTADANVVMSNFACAALTDGSTINNLSLTGSTTAANVTAANYYSTGVAFRLGYITSYPYIDLYGSGGNLMAFGIGGSEVARFSSGGNLLLGTTANSGRLTINTGAQWGLVIDGLDTGHSGQYFQSIFLANGTQVGSIASTSSQTFYNTTSDERLKSVAGRQRDYRAAIEKLWVGDFVWKKTGRPDFGIRAQQAYGIFPYAISKPTNPADQWQADYGKLSPLALWGVKDLYRRADRQQQTIEHLQKDVVSLRAENEKLLNALRLMQGHVAALEKSFHKRVALN